MRLRRVGAISHTSNPSPTPARPPEAHASLDPRNISSDHPSAPCTPAPPPAASTSDSAISPVPPTSASWTDTGSSTVCHRWSPSLSSLTYPSTTGATVAGAATTSAQRLALQPVLLRPLQDGRFVQGDEGGAEVPVGAVHQDVGDVRTDGLELALDSAGAMYLPPEVLMRSVGDPERPVGPQLADVAGAGNQPSDSRTSAVFSGSPGSPP